MKVLLLEHKKRKKSGIPEHPDFYVHSYKNPSGSRIYRIHSRKDDSEIGMFRGSRVPENPSKFYIDLIGAHAAGDAGSAEAEHARLSGHRFLSRSMMSHLIKHVKRDFPNITRVAARRVSGANPERDIDIHVAKPTAKQVALQNRLTAGYTREFQVRKKKGRYLPRLDYEQENSYSHSANPSPERGRDVYSMSNNYKLGVIKSIARAAQKIPGVKKLHIYRKGDIVLHKPKKSTYVIKPNYDIEHTRKGLVGHVNRFVRSWGKKGMVSVPGIDYESGDRKGPKPKFGEIRRIYRAVKSRMHKEYPDATKYARRIDGSRLKELKLRHP